MLVNYQYLLVFLCCLYNLTRDIDSAETCSMPDDSKTPEMVKSCQIIRSHVDAT